MHFKKHTVLFFFLLAFLTANYGWAQIPPKLTATGAQIYCPQSELPIVTSFDISNPDNVEIKAVYIQISAGYVRGEDQLNLSGIYPNITAQPFNILEGKLELRWTGTGNTVISELISAVKNVKFKSSSIMPSGSRTFSITIGEANYLPSTGHYYEYVSNPRITWKDAKIDAENKLYYGRQGYLATITTREEAVLSGEQAGGQGWIGGSDEETEGVWKWVTGPETGMVFWNGLANGSSPPGVYSNWATGEPNDWPNPSIAKEENYAHIYETGKWNDYPNFNNDIKGYIVEYGKPGDLPLNISTSTTISVAAITAPTNDTRCGVGTLNLSATATTGATVLWFDSLTSTTILHTGSNYAPVLSATTTFYVLASANGCVTGKRTAITATVNPLPIIQSPIEFKNCDEDGIADGFTDFNLNEVTPIITNNDASLTVTYHLTASDANASPGANPINPVSFNNADATASTVYAKVQNTFDCYSISTVKLSVSSTLLPAGFNYVLTACDKDTNADGFFAFNLTEASTYFINSLPAGQPLSVYYFRTLNDARLELNEIPPANYTNQTKDSQILFVRIENENDGNCYGIGPYLTLNVQQIPQFEVISTAIVCLNLPPITLETFNAQGNYTYQWTDDTGAVISNDSSAEVSSAGIYTVIATLNCESFPKTVTVTASDIATITMNDITVVDDSYNNSITVNNTNLGLGDYAFSLDAPFGPFQDETSFENLLPGIYTLYVNDKNSCGVAALDIAILGFPKFFTPNDDGQNDTWKVLGNDTNNIQISAIYIFNRFGKLVAEIAATDDGWDGFYNGEMLPASDYWYLVKYTDQYGDYREKRGNLSLIRR